MNTNNVKKNISDALLDDENKTCKNITISKLRLLKYNIDKFNTNEKKTEVLLKNIKYSFDILNNIIKFLIINSKKKYDKNSHIQNKDINEIYKLIKLPKSIDKLILLISYFPKSFDDFSQKKFYDIISLEFYNQLYSIYEINDLLMPFIDNGDISVELLSKDFDILYEYIVELATVIFNLNTDFENISYF